MTGAPMWQGIGEELHLILSDHASVTTTKMNVRRLIELLGTV